MLIDTKIDENFNGKNDREAYEQCPISHFIGFLENYEASEKYRINGTEFYDQYVCYSMRRDVIPMPIIEFYRRVRNLGLKIIRKDIGYKIKAVKKSKLNSVTGDGY